MSFKNAIGFFAAQGGYCDEYQAWYNAMPNKPPDSVATAQNTFVQTLVDAAIWTGFDIAYLLAQYSNTASEALINIVNPGTNNATLIGNPAFVSLEGFTGDGGVNYITTNFNGNSGVNYTLNNCSVGVYTRDMIAANTWLLFASEGGNLIIVYALGGTRTNRVYLNDSGYGNAVVIPAAGMCIHGRSDANTVHNFINKSYASAIASSSAIPNTNILLISDSFSQLSFAFAGRYFNEAEMGIIQDALEVYMDSNGKGVI